MRHVAAAPPRRGVLSRAIAAVVGGYALANALSVLLVQLLGGGTLARADAVLVSMMLSFSIYAGAVMWAFAAGSARMAWIGIAAPAVAAGLLSWTLS